jgi:hypothetical protein
LARNIEAYLALAHCALSIIRSFDTDQRISATREPYLATTGGRDESMSSVSSIAGAVNVVLPRGKDDDQNWPPKAPIESITPSSRVYQHHRPEAVLHPSTPGSGETV